MQSFLEGYEDLYEHPLTIKNKECNVIIDCNSYIKDTTNLYFNKNRGTFMCTHQLTWIDYIRSMKSQNPIYLNFVYNTFIISYNFVYRVIVVYMGKGFNDEELDKFSNIIPKFEGFKVIKNNTESSFRCYNRKYENQIINNILKFISEDPLECRKYISKYISKSYNYSVRLKLYDQLDDLHNNLNMISMSNTYTSNGPYIIVFKHIKLNTDLVINIGGESLLVDVYNRDHQIIYIFDLPHPGFISTGDICIYSISDNIDINMEECYYCLLKLITEKCFQIQPLNNNSPSSE